MHKTQDKHIDFCVFKFLKMLSTCFLMTCLFFMHSHQKTKIRGEKNEEVKKNELF